MELINRDLLERPLNWAIVWVFATITLLLMHVIMQGFSAMQAPANQSSFGNPGQVAIPDATASFSQYSTLATATSGLPGAFFGGGLDAGDGTWSDETVPRYAEDGSNLSGF